MVSQILFNALVATLLIMVWVVVFLIFDAEVLNGYFKKKLQKRFNVEDVE